MIESVDFHTKENYETDKLYTGPVLPTQKALGDFKKVLEPQKKHKGLVFKALELKKDTKYVPIAYKPKQNAQVNSW